MFEGLEGDAMDTKDISKGIRIIPMTEFWVDCYTTAIFSVLLTYCNVDKRLAYNNSYKYVFDVNPRKQLGRVFVKTDLDDLVKELLISEEKHNFSLDEDVPMSLISYLKEEKLVMLGIDMFFGIHETSQWHRHHIRHNIIVERFDEINKHFVVLETGETGYKEYYLSYESISIAAKMFKNPSSIYTINRQYTAKLYDMATIKENALAICQSIDEVLGHLDEMWHVENENILSMRDEIDTHLKSMANRQKVNYLLLEGLHIRRVTQKYEEIFLTLEKKYFNLREFFFSSCSHSVYYENETRIKQELVKLLNIEKDVWKSLCECL